MRIPPTERQPLARANVSQNYLHGLEVGLNRPSVDIAMDLADELGISVYELMGRHNRAPHHFYEMAKELKRLPMDAEGES